MEQPDGPDRARTVYRFGSVIYILGVSGLLLILYLLFTL